MVTINKSNKKITNISELSSESLEQQKIFAWAEQMAYAYPDLDLMYHIPNEGKRSIYTGNKLKKEGLKKGVPDICLPVPSGKYAGLYIEMKFGNNKTTSEQENYLYRLSKRGYAVKVCYSSEEGINTIKQYYKLSENQCLNCKNILKSQNCENYSSEKDYCYYIKNKPTPKECNTCNYYAPKSEFCYKCGKRIIVK